MHTHTHTHTHTHKHKHTHTHTHTVLLEGTSDQAQANDFLWLGTKQCTCHTHHTSNRHTHAHISHLEIVCVQNRRACLCVYVCVSVSSVSTERSLQTRPWFVLGTASWVTTPPEREREHNENRKPILR